MVEQGNDIIFSNNILFGNDDSKKLESEIDALKEKAEVESSNISIDDIDVELNKKDSNPNEGIEIKKDEITSIEPKLEVDNAVKGKPEYGNLLKSFGIDKYIIEDNGEDLEVDIDNSDLDLDTTIELLKSYFENGKSHIKENSISIDGIDEERKELIDFIAKGGDPNKLISHQSEIDKVRQYDLYLDEDAEDVIRYYYNLKGLDEETAESAIAGAKSRGVLTETAEKASLAITDYFKNQQEVEKNLLDEQIKFKENAFKEYKKNLKENFKSNGYTDTLIKKAIDFSTQKIKVKNPNGLEVDTYEMDVVYQQHRANPEKAVDLTLFLLDKDAYLKKALEEKEIELKKKIILDTRKAKIVRAGSNSVAKTNFEKNNEAIDIIPIV